MKKENQKKFRNPKWTMQRTNKKLDEIIEFLDTDEDALTIQDLAIHFGLWYSWFRKKRKEFSEKEEIKNKFDYIYDTMENRVWRSTAFGKIRESLGIFTLKAYHQRIEQQHIKTENENTHSFDKIELNINYPKKNED